MKEQQLTKLILGRRKSCGIGLQGSCECIARWLFRKHNVLTSTAHVAKVIQETP